MYLCSLEYSDNILLQYKYSIMDKFSCVTDVYKRNNNIIIEYYDDCNKDAIDNFVQCIIDGHIEKKIIFSIDEQDNIIEH